ncbi:MAG TPA: hypothetical protein VN043_09440 [Rhodanobacter sp.]|nr:hypothetical protein [Rhodanobacter sp.]
MLAAGAIPDVANRFGYARAFSRAASTAIQEDLAICLAELRAESLAPEQPFASSAVKYFQPNSTGLFALVECFVSTDNGAQILVELVVTSNDANKYVCLEDFSAVGASSAMPESCR